MRADELMVGDWVKWKDKYVQIATISGIVYSFGHIDVELAHCGSGLIERHDLKSVSPIPLTSEILKANGFSECANGLYAYEVKNRIVIIVFFFPNAKEGESKIVVNIDCSCSLKDGSNSLHSCDINYVHELQHAVRLCGLNELAGDFEVKD